MKKIFANQRLMKYLLMAVTVVVIELITFQVVYLLTRNYYLSTVISFIVGVILNWVAGRLFVFGISHHHPAREFSMVLIGSLVGLGIQVFVVFLSVQLMDLYPLIGKILSIAFSFFWNYWFRATIIYKKH